VGGYIIPKYSQVYKALMFGISNLNFYLWLVTFWGMIFNAAKDTMAIIVVKIKQTLG
jgi:hypothetical protein